MFSDRQLKALKPRDKPYREYEKGALPGFHIQVTPHGRKTFGLAFTFDGKRRFMSIGRYPAVSLQEARARAQAAREEVDRGSGEVRWRFTAHLACAASAPAQFATRPSCTSKT